VKNVMKNINLNVKEEADADRNQFQNHRDYPG
jgi:hypothetical protein